MKTQAQKEANSRWVKKNRAYLTRYQRERRIRMAKNKIEKARLWATTHF